MRTIRYYTIVAREKPSRHNRFITRKNAAFQLRFPAFFVFIPYISMLYFRFYMQFALNVYFSVLRLQLAHQVKKHSHAGPLLTFCFFNCIYHTTHLRQTQYETYPKLTNDIFINCAVYDLNVQFSRIILNLQQKKTRGKRCPACPSVTEEKPVKSCCKCPGTS